MSRQILRRAHASLLPLLLLAATATPSSAQSAGEVLERAIERHEAAIADVRDYTVTQEVMGFTTTTRFVKKEVEGHPMFVPADAGEEGEAPVPEGWGNPYRMLPELASRAEITGNGSVEGHDTWVVEVESLEGLDFQGMTPAEVEGEFRPTALRVQVGKEDYLLRQVHLAGEVTTEGAGARPVAVTASLMDYRTIEGMPYPFMTRLHIEGLSGAMPQADQEEARRQLQQLREQMANMPEQQRKMMEEMMGSQLENLEKMVEGGAIDLTVRTTSVDVNRRSDR